MSLIIKDSQKAPQKKEGYLIITIKLGQIVTVGEEGDFFKVTAVNGNKLKLAFKGKQKVVAQKAPLIGRGEVIEIPDVT